ncbi:outer membrane beta-barrel protein [uncultured Bacteroides sp.]|uniref:TonB-dependent receptor plug domain-containing protein n=1 Tax=uncultured Bacteroides sp. TaxID=162156 RepID=UPI002AABDF0A|nr:outer membrane beta-barrel protein [uncultured Bacteroides sp.]
MKFKFLSLFLAVCMVNASAQEKSESSNMTVSHGKISYNVSADNESQTTNLLEILQKYPMIAVDGLGQMTLNGVADFGLSIDGKFFSIQSPLTADILKSIPAKTVDKVEILTNPSSALLMECSGGVINIVTKKQIIDGTDVSLGLNATTLGLLGGDASFNTKRKGLMLNGTYSYGFDNYSKSAISTVAYNGVQTKETKVHPEKLHRANVNAFYQLTKRDGMGVAFNLFSNPVTLPLESVMSYPQSNFYIKDNSTEDITPSYYNISAYYAHLFSPNGTKLSITYSYNNQPITDNYTSEGVINSNDQVTNLSSYSNEKYNQKRQDAIVDFVLPFALHHEISIGGRYSWIKDNDSYNYLDTRNSEKQSFGYNHFKIDFDRWYTYLQYQFHSKDFQLTTAVSTEQKQYLSWVIYDENIINILPSLNLSYAFNKNSIIRADYHSHLASSLWMSNSSLVSPLYDQQNASSYNDGRAHFFHLGYSKITSKFNFLLDANYIYGGNRIGKMKVVLPPLTTNTETLYAMWDGLCFQKTIVSATASYQFSKAMKLQLFATGGYSDEDYMRIEGKLTKTGFDGSLVASSWLSLPDGYMLNLNGGYYFPRKSVALDSFNNYFYRVRASKNLLKDKLTVAIFANDFITRKKDVKQYDIVGNDIKLKTTGREFGLSMVYHFSIW